MVSVLADAALKTKPPPRVGVGKMVAPRANTTRMEDFEVQRKLGQGSFGVVYAVTRKRDLTKRRTFVIKQVELGPRRSEQEAAIDECRVLSKMDSKYVVKYFESFITKGDEAVHRHGVRAQGTSPTRSTRREARSLGNDDTHPFSPGGDLFFTPV
jgi:serine/threonine protein kinase